jgi:hypothetical protein
MMADGFLSRWSRRKSGIQEDPSEPVKESEQAPVTNSPEAEMQASEAPPLPTIEDVEKIDRFAPDFSAFMKPDVDPAVQQAALKKMFSDPHFNVMDGLDIYIDDYSKPDPLPAGMLERMVQSDMLKLFQTPANSTDTESQKEGDRSARSSSEVSPNPPALKQSSKSDLTSPALSEIEKSVNVNAEQIKSDQKKT